ncbi:Fur family transcriptional regulator [Agromyces archimandritae]|uniref:Transcriptional repressor n=1 Tax=Agromyces archimandritae TaxID=2781962 RepID=A0A975IPZ8_9MICO|nr:Fur family transcriptional regulator [Agromyces archimandritae]QTX05824.1 transcriptional repressor [Agromyces archimandritae]
MPEQYDAPHARVLRDAGLKVTAPRLAVLDALEDHPHEGAEAVYARVAETLPSTSLQAVYGVLGALADAGILRRIEPAGSPARYERRVGDNHHHLVCTGCGRVEDVDCLVGASPCLTPGHDHGFRIERAEVTFWGVCADCRAVDAVAHGDGAAPEGRPTASTPEPIV